MNLSYWEKDTYFSNIDILIIGSGIVGLTAALELKSANPSQKIIVIERGFLPCGASSKNAGLWPIQQAARVRFHAAGRESFFLNPWTHWRRQIHIV